MLLLVVCAEENGNETAEFSPTDYTITSLHFPTEPALYPIYTLSSRKPKSQVQIHRKHHV